MSRFALHHRGVTRRDFLTTASVTAAGMMCGFSRMLAGNVLTTSLDTPQSAEHWLEPSVPDLLRSLAQRAVDAAMHAGASYADVRIAEQQVLAPEIDPLGRFVRIISQCTFGVRARVNGVWGFAYGRVPTPDAVARCAEDAVQSARMTAHLTPSDNPRKVDSTWMPAPAATGEWETPIQIDPFTVPLQQHGEAITALMRAAEYVYGAMMNIKPTWVRETRVLATSAGSLLTQRKRTVTFDINNYLVYGHNWVALRIPDLHGASVGYEVLTNPILQNRIKAASEEAASLVRLPRGSLDVGRYPVVFDGTTTGAFLSHLVGPALELDRVLGDEADSVGTSIFSIDQLGALVASPSLTVTAHRAVPSVSAARWDDDGAETRAHTVIRGGHLTDFHTDGQTVSALRSWYERQGQPVTSNGCSTVADAGNFPLLQSPHLAMTAATENVSMEDLCKEMKRGILVVYQDWLAPDRQIASATLYPRVGSSSAGYVKAGGMMFEIAQGKIVRRINGVALQLSTLPFLKNMTAIGGSSTIHEAATFVSKGMPWQFAFNGTTAPAVSFKEVNAISAGPS